jgi:hypothetical protein
MSSSRILAVFLAVGFPTLTRSFFWHQRWLFLSSILYMHVCTLVFTSLPRTYVNCLVTALYHLFSNHRTNTKILTPHLRSRDSALSGAQYYRLMIMSVILGTWGVVWISIEIQANVAGGISPLPSWNVMHQDSNISFEIPTASMSQSSLHNLLLLWWGIPGGAYLYFVVFGTSRDVFAEYPRLWSWVRMKVLRLPPPARSEMSSLTTFTMPQFGYVMLTLRFVNLEFIFSLERHFRVACRFTSTPRSSQTIWSQTKRKFTVPLLSLPIPRLRINTISGIAWRWIFFTLYGEIIYGIWNLLMGDTCKHRVHHMEAQKGRHPKKA